MTGNSARDPQDPCEYAFVHHFFPLASNSTAALSPVSPLHYRNDSLNQLLQSASFLLPSYQALSFLAFSQHPFPLKLPTPSPRPPVPSVSPFPPSLVTPAGSAMVAIATAWGPHLPPGWSTNDIVEPDLECSQWDGVMCDVDGNIVSM